MAYFNPYNPTQTTTYPNPYSQYSVNIPQNQPVQQQQSDGGIIWVQGEAGAKSFPVAPGKSVMLLDSEQARFYIKSADSSGMPMPLRIFEFNELTQTNNTVQDADDIYVTREEFEELLERFDKFTQKTATKKER